MSPTERLGLNDVLLSPWAKDVIALIFSHSASDLSNEKLRLAFYGAVRIHVEGEF